MAPYSQEGFAVDDEGLALDDHAGTVRGQRKQRTVEPVDGLVGRGCARRRPTTNQRRIRTTFQPHWVPEPGC